MHQTLAQARRIAFVVRTTHRAMRRTLAKGSGKGQMQRAEAKGSGGASQPAERTADASQLVGLPTVRLNLGCFNTGIDQLMLPLAVHQKNLGRVIAKGVAEQDLHMLTLCEVGGHKKGLALCEVVVHKKEEDESKKGAQKLVSKYLTSHYKAISCQAYMATWQAEEEPGDCTSVTLTLVGEPQVVEFPETVQPQLVIMVFIIAAAEHPDKHGLLISGCLHIRTPSGESSHTKKPTRTRIVKAALQALEQRALTASSGVSQPTAPVFVLTGDVNMNKNECDTIVQNDLGEPSVETHWQVKTSNGQLSGDVLFIKGAFGESFDVSVGNSYEDRGIRNDQHDFFGVALSIPMFDKEPRGQKRQQVPAGGGTHPAAKEQKQVLLPVKPKSSSSGATQPVHLAPTQDSGSSSKESSSSGATQPVHFAPTQESGISTKVKLSESESESPRAPKSSTSGAAQPAVPLPEDPEEKRMARNNGAYTKASFQAFYCAAGADCVDQKWAAASPAVRRGPMNALTGRVLRPAERIVQEMYDWYEARVDDEELHAVFRHLQNTLFKNVTVQLSEDVWKHTDVGGASQLAEQGEAHLVVSREHVARQVHTVITCREKWLQGRGLPSHHVIRGELADRFLADAKAEFHASAFQQELQERDREVSKKKLQSGKHSRWGRHTQKLGGTSQMWTLLSFTGRFDVGYLKDAIEKGAKVPPTMPGERTDEHKQQTLDAQMARCRLRHGAMVERLHKRLKGKGKGEAWPLTPKQQRVLHDFNNGELLYQANKFTMISGNGRLKRKDDSFLDIGGSTGGFVRTVLDDFEPPDLADF